SRCPRGRGRWRDRRGGARPRGDAPGDPCRARSASRGTATGARDDVLRGEDPVDDRRGAEAPARDREEQDAPWDAPAARPRRGGGVMTTSDRSHDLIEELVAADVLHGLDELDRRRLERELESHGPDCEECDQLIAEYSEVAARLAVPLDPAAPSAEAEERVIALLREREDTSGEPERAGREGPPTRGASRRRWVAFIAVAAAFAVLGGLVGRALPRTGTRVDQRFLAFAAEPGTRFIAFPPKDGETLAVAVNPAAPGGWIVGSGLPGLADGKVYEL